jgi:hypothetical protein
MVEPYLHCPIPLHGLVLNELNTATILPFAFTISGLYLQSHLSLQDFRLRCCINFPSLSCGMFPDRLIHLLHLLIRFSPTCYFSLKSTCFFQVPEVQNKVQRTIIGPRPEPIPKYLGLLFRYGLGLKQLVFHPVIHGLSVFGSPNPKRSRPPVKVSPTSQDTKCSYIYSEF